MLGRELESQLGHVRFVCLYLLAGLGGSVASFWFSAPFLEVSPGVYQPIPSLGASGAVFGLMGAYLVIGRFLSLDVSQVFGLLVINVLLGFVWPNTDWRAHLGGLATGALVAALFAYAPRRQRVLAETAGLVGILALLVLLTLVRDSQLTQELDRLGIRPAASSAQAGGPTGAQATVQ
jgi:membrane associated rhomboid family serine protease